jgi:hypothetical protein
MGAKRGWLYVGGWRRDEDIKQTLLSVQIDYTINSFEFGVMGATCRCLIRNLLFKNNEI